ncbi:hypothetical protein SAMN04487864_11547 [Succiniclasticum ruminis]|uniref:Uncharacterized protein n=2 Tax=Succiniclasticum ruminis TaxID=40841 RepID=A0A1G6NPZ7_9FIRM|nr:hypothetical protein SAMN04487864_11547 [Succiniclasticum ruminis]
MDRHAVAMSTTGGQIVYENHAQDYRLKETKVIPTLGVNPTRNPTLVTEIIPNVTMSTTGGQKCWTTSKASFMTNFTEEKAQTLVATDWKDAPVLVTENKQLEACAPMTDEDLTDKM